MQQTAEAFKPVQPSERIQLVDVVRGFAVFGILVANMSSFAGGYPSLSSAQGLSRVVLALTTFFITAKFYSLFSFLFGWGMAVQMRRAEKRGVSFVPAYLRRLVVLLLIGLVHGILIWSGDILTVYALLGFVLLLLRKRSVRFLLAGVVVSLLLSIFLVTPQAAPIREWYGDATEFIRVPSTVNESQYGRGSYAQITGLRLSDFTSANSNLLYYFGNVFAMFLLGLLAGRNQVFAHLNRYLPRLRTLVWLFLLAGALFNGVFLYMGLNPTWGPEEYRRLLSVGSRTIGAPLLMLFYVSALALLFQYPSWRERLLPLAPVGRLALTNYLLQSVIATLIFYGYGLGLYGEFGPVGGLVFTIIIFLWQIRFSQWWLERYRFGPVEWLWRVLAYMRWQPIRRGVTERLQPEWERRLRESVARHPMVLLAVVWSLLGAWAVLLGGWYVSLQHQAPHQIQVYVPQATATPKPGAEAEEQQDVVQDQGRPTIETYPVEYNPPADVARGDIWALAGAFDVGRAMQHVETLTAPPNNGRYAGSPGGHAAGDYIARQFSRYRLQPAGVDSTYFQPFPVEYEGLASIPQFQIRSADDSRSWNPKLYEDYTPVLASYMGAGEAEGTVAYMDDCGYEDFVLLEVVDKVVWCGDSAQPEDAARNALEHGAVGLLLSGNASTRPADFGVVRRPAWVPEPLPTVRIYDEAAGFLLRGSGYELTDLQKADLVFDLESRVSMSVETQGDGACAEGGCFARNVLGVLPGRDPDYADEVVILGAHYDHVGEGPDGTVWAGANDDASGVAALMEMARTWAEQGYVPRRTVIFAAWDAEEMGSLGARHFINNPPYPFSQIKGMIQLDMVGAGPDTLSISGEDNLSQKLFKLGESLGIQSAISSLANSDHGPFLQSSVNAALLIWEEDDRIALNYHRPSDTVEQIDPEKLRSAAVVADIAILEMVESEPAILDLVAEREAALQDGDKGAYLRTSHAIARHTDGIWFEDLVGLAETVGDDEEAAGAPLPGLTASIGVEDLQVLGDRATANLVLDLKYTRPISLASEEESEAGEQPGEELLWSHRTPLPALFLRGYDGWKYAGPNMVYEPAEPALASFPVAHSPNLQADWAKLSERAAEEYATIAGLLGQPTSPDAELMLFEDLVSLRAATSLALPAEQDAYVDEQSVRLVFTEGISESHSLQDAMVHLVLAEAGLRGEYAPWLWNGLPTVMQVHRNRTEGFREHLPALIQALLPEDESTEENIEGASPALDWAAVQYLRDQLGWDGLGVFIGSLGDACSGGRCSTDAGRDTALTAALGRNQADFTRAWQGDWRSRIASAQGSLDRVLQRREDALVRGDREAFLATASFDLAVEEGLWFDAVQEAPSEDLSFSAQPRVLYEDGAILANVNLSYTHPGGILQTRSFDVLFEPGQGGYQWMGAPVEVLHGERLRLLFPKGFDEIAGQFLELAEGYSLELAGVLGVDPEAFDIVLFADPVGFTASIAPGYRTHEWSDVWSGEDADLKLLLYEDQAIEEYQSDLALHIARRMLLSLGVQDEWLLKGLAPFLARPLDKGESEWVAASWEGDLETANKINTLFELGDMPLDAALQNEDVGVARAQSYSAVQFLLARHGWENVLQYVKSGGGQGAFRRTFGETFQDFRTAWENSIAEGGIEAAWENAARAFDSGAAMEHVEYLVSPQLAGRGAGSHGEKLAAQYIAEQFDAYGLNPVGDLEGTTYFQTVPISRSNWISAPLLELEDLSSGERNLLAFREDFLPLRQSALGGKAVVGELVVVDPESFDGEDLSNKIVVTVMNQELEEGVAFYASHGAAGVLVRGFRREPEEVFGKDPLVMYRGSAPIPVFELTAGGYVHLLELAGESPSSIQSFAAVHPLGIRARMRLAISPPEMSASANVLGLLMGRDPLLGKEVLILGAHYDHVGNDPDIRVCSEGGQCETIPGLRYSGGSDNASGVAVLLEIARLFHEQGYQPARSILFAAWGAEELGQVGSKYFLDHPTVPITNTLLGVVQLDGVSGGDGFNLGAQADPDTNDALLLHAIYAAMDRLGEKVVHAPQSEASDHYTFRDVGIPNMLLQWRLAGEHNLPDGYANGVSQDKMALTGRVASLAVMILSR